MLRRINIFPGLLPSVLLVLAVSLAASAQNPPQRSLYQRLGGYDAIASITDAFLARTRARQLSVDLLCELSGGPCTYIGRPLQAAHSGLGVTAADWDAFIGHVAASLDQLKIPAPEKQEFLALFSKMKMEIVERGRN